MEKTHILKHNGYDVGDRLLEDVFFDVEIIESGETLTIGQISPSKSVEAEAYLASIRWENFVPAMERLIQWKIDHHMAWLIANGKTLREDMESYAKEEGEDEINVLNEV